MNRERVLLDIADAAEELCDPRQHREPRWGWSPSRHKVRLPDHVTVQPSLLDQLAEAAVPGARAEDGGRSVPGSRPPVDLEAVSRWAAIQIGAVRLCWSLCIEVRDDVASTVRAVVGAAAAADSDSQQFVLGELRSWWYWAATLTGWKTPPWRPDAPCPHCERRNVLVVNLDRKVAYCRGMDCRAGWSELDGTLGLLADHIRACRTETGKDVGTDLDGEFSCSGLVRMRRAARLLHVDTDAVARLARAGQLRTAHVPWLGRAFRGVAVEELLELHRRLWPAGCPLGTECETTGE